MQPQSAYRPLSILVPWRLELGRIFRALLDFVNVDYKLKVSARHCYLVHDLTPLLALQCSRHWLSTTSRPPSVVLHPLYLLRCARWHPYRYSWSYGCPDSPADFFWHLRTDLSGVVCSFQYVLTPWEHGVGIFTYIEFSTYRPFIKLA